MLESVPELESFKKSVKEEGLLMVIDDTLKDFKNLIIPKLHTFERGVIHGDFNEQNILVTLNTNSKM